MLLSRAAQNLNQLGDFRWVTLSNASEAETASVLREAFLFVFLSTEEGLGRMPIEAMACGCLVVAAAGGPLETVLPRREYQFTSFDLPAMIKHIENVAAGWERRAANYASLIERAREQALRYSSEMFERQLLAAWKSLIEGGTHTHCGPAPFTAHTAVVQAGCGSETCAGFP